MISSPELRFQVRAVPAKIEKPEVCPSVASKGKRRMERRESYLACVRIPAEKFVPSGNSRPDQRLAPRNSLKGSGLASNIASAPHSKAIDGALDEGKTRPANKKRADQRDSLRLLMVTPFGEPVLAAWINRDSPTYMATWSGFAESRAAVGSSTKKSRSPGLSSERGIFCTQSACWATVRGIRDDAGPAEETLAVITPELIARVKTA